jgi:coenzyme F420-reducing hydrogenase beta subunit
MDWDGEGQLRPAGPAPWMHARTERFARLCPFSPAAATEDEIGTERFGAAGAADPWIGRYRAAYVGYAAEHGFRDQGSSGGMVSWVAAELLRHGLVDGVAHVAPADPQADGRFFQYRISRDQDALRAGAKSRYYPVELSGVLREMRERPGRYAVVGIPCFIKAVHLACLGDPVLGERVAFTLGLVCGHMKSRHMIDSFATWMMSNGWIIGSRMPSAPPIGTPRA